MELVTNLKRSRVKEKEKEATPVPDNGTLVIDMHGHVLRSVLRVSLSWLFRYHHTSFIKASVVLQVVSLIYLYFIN